MIYKIAADLTIFTHFLWIIFMVIGVILTAYHLIRKNKTFFDRWILRTIHFAGILYVASLAVLNKYCPLTILENYLRGKHDPGFVYTGSFIAHYMEKFVYPSVEPILIIIPTIISGIFTAVVFILKPPAKIKKFFKKKTLS